MAKIQTSVETVPESSESAATPAVGPLDAYSPERWARLEKMGWAWNANISRAWTNKGSLPVTVAVPVPGDPAYTTHPQEEIASHSGV